jgi:hypothetical protein
LGFVSDLGFRVFFLPFVSDFELRISSFPPFLFRISRFEFRIFGLPPMSHDPQPLSVALAELIALRGFARVRSDDELQSAWKQVAGDEWAGQSRPLQVTRGVLTVAVSSAPLLNELVSFRTAELLQRLKQLYPHLKVKSLKFRLTGM